MGSTAKGLAGVVVLLAAMAATAAGVQVVEDNSAQVLQHGKLKGAAGRYVAELDKEVGRIEEMAGKSIDGAARAAQARKMVELKRQGEAYGPAFSSPLDRCMQAGVFARKYWDVMTGTITTAAPGEALAEYRKYSSACRLQIGKTPKAEVVLRAADGKPPFKGCLRVMTPDEVPGRSVLWACPKDRVKV